MISSELPEVLGMSDRIVVMNSGRLVGEFECTENPTQEDIMACAVGDSALNPGTFLGGTI